MASAGLNTVGALPIGNLPATSSIAIGAGGALTVDNTVSPAAVTVAGPLITSGPMTNRPVSIRVVKTADQSVGALVSTAVTWDALAPGGGAVNFPGFSAGASAFTIPVAGTYLIAASVAWGASAPGVIITAWVEVGTAPIGSTARWGYAVAFSSTQTISSSPTAVFQFSGGEQVRVGAFVFSSPLSLIASPSPGVMALSIVRLGS